MTDEIEPGEVVTFWREAGPEKWFKKDDAFDHEIAERFLPLHAEASAGKLDHWLGDAQGSLALILVLDQFSRNLFRDSPKAFAQDPKALEIAERSLRNGFDEQTEADLRCFFYLPLEHSESLSDQDRCVALIHALDDAEYLKYAIVHRVIIRRFGRFPHRNEVLGRHTSPAEQAFLDSGGFSG